MNSGDRYNNDTFTENYDRQDASVFAFKYEPVRVCATLWSVTRPSQPPQPLIVCVLQWW